MVSIIGVPWDGSSSFARGAGEAPARIRDALWSPSTNAYNERGDDLSAAAWLSDAGNLTLPADAAAAREAITAAVRQLLAAGRKPLVLGGDHSISYPVLRAFAGRSGPVTILHLDAHADLYDEFDGDRYSHACPFARIMEERLAARLVQVGVRTLTAHQRAQAAKFGVETLGADRWRDSLPLVARVKPPVYVSLDLDVIEPMLAPGVAHPEPGGLTVREVIEVITALRVPVAGADVVEYNPRYDLRDLTARVAAKLVKELAAAMKS